MSRKNGTKEIKLTKSQQIGLAMLNQRRQDLQAAFNEQVAAYYRALEDDHGLELGAIGQRFDPNILHAQFALVEISEGQAEPRLEEQGT